jgi:AmmeMemoRadiSam system protein A
MTGAGQTIGGPTSRRDAVSDATPQLDPDARQELLALARKTLEACVASRKIPEYRTEKPALLARCGAFVSLHAGPRLRGCIGQIISDEALYRTVQRCTYSAALEDYRFTPVTPEEVGDLTIEISVLTPMRRVADIGEITVGRHGLYIVRGMNRGLLLPQVATQYGWDRETFLIQTCRKAGLEDDAWRRPGTAIHVFEAQVFGE